MKYPSNSKLGPLGAFDPLSGPFNPLSPFSPLSAMGLWTRLAVDTAEMMMASSQVIGYRTGRMAVAGPVPNASDRREFELMGREKLEAAVESAQAMALQWYALNQRLGMRMVGQMLATSTAMMSVATSPSLSQSIVRQKRLARAMNRSAGTASVLSRSAARVTRSGLEPIRARATANARRLSRQEKK